MGLGLLLRCSLLPFAAAVVQDQSISVWSGHLFKALSPRGLPPAFPVPKAVSTVLPLPVTHVFTQNFPRYQ